MYIYKQPQYKIPTNLKLKKKKKKTQHRGERNLPSGHIGNLWPLHFVWLPHVCNVIEYSIEKLLFFILLFDFIVFLFLFYFYC